MFAGNGNNRLCGLRRGVAVLVLVSFPALAAAGGLDGQVFDVEMLPEGADEPIDNTLTFRSGTFLSAVCVNHDFPQSDYSVTEADDGSLRFKVNAESYTKGHMNWEGRVVGDRLEATAVWHRPDRDELIEFEISGTRK